MLKTRRLKGSRDEARATPAWSFNNERPRAPRAPSSKMTPRRTEYITIT